jgi:hypothetical protein
MKPLSFKEFMKQQESSPFTRSRPQWLMGLGPDMPDAAIFSRSTADPREVEYHDKEVKKKKKKKKKRKKKRKGKKLSEAEAAPPMHPEVDKWLRAVDQLKKDFGILDVDEDEDEKEEEDEEETDSDPREPKNGDVKKPDLDPEEEGGDEDEYEGEDETEPYPTL